MGLDMYLTKKTYVGNEYRKPEEMIKVIMPESQKDVTFPTKIPIKNERISEISERVGYWRKANQIHKWFVDNIQNGTDDCGEYKLSKEKALELLGVCKEIKDKCKLEIGKVRNGQTASAETNGKFVDNIEDGKLMTNSHIAAKLLPSASGFFFGSTDYGQYYMNDIDNTIEILEQLIGEDDSTKEYFTQEIYYSSSW